ncbi:MAG TPA: glycosyl hydrolase family 28-related protein [Planctomycetota bacterium]|nr:glycosyl hydrolase family 28-related protein [Planctomycetota bacterium]
MTTRSALLLACLFVASHDASADKQNGILPDDRVADWRPGSSVGVPGGIPTTRKVLLDVTKPPFNVDPTGAQDAQPGIALAVAKAAENEVVYLPAGTYRLNRGIALGCKSRITIRGAGPDKTFLKMAPGCNAAIDIGGGGGDWWYPDRLKLPVLGSPKRKTTVLPISDPKPLDALPNGGVGMLCQIALKNDPKLPVIVPANFEYMRRQISRIVARSATSVTISPGLLTDHPEALAPRLAPNARTAEFVGVEDLTVDGENCNAQLGLNLSTAFGCWIRNVHVLNITNYHVSISDSLQCEIRHSMIAKRKGLGSNGAGFLVGTVSNCLFEDNILTEQFPHIEVNGSSGNVFAYNFCHDSTIMGVVGCSINTNHGAHSNFNLYEGNVSPKFQSDGYHGGSSHDTAFRNWFHGSSDKTDQFWICVNLNRFTRCYSLVGNVLGSPGQRWIYDNADNGYGYDQHLIYSFGMPNMGNGGFKGTAQPSKGRPWKDWESVRSGPAGKGPGPGGFQELDLDVRATTLVKGNYNYKDKGVAPGEALNGSTLPKSLYRSEKPAWFGELPWPAFGPDTAFEKNKIPAQLRFEAMKK